MEKKKNILFLLITDTHLNEFNIDYIEEFIKEAIGICFKYKIRKIKHLGDFLDSRKSQTIEVLLSLKRILLLLEESNIELEGLVGNHDRAVDNKDSYLSIYDRYKGIKFFEDLYFQELPNLNIVYLPYNKSKFDFYYKEIINRNFNTNKSILFAHQQHSEIPMEVQVKFNKVFMGHIHDKEDISERSKYIGSAYQQNFSEDDDKGFTLLYDDLSITQIKSKFPKFFIENIDLNAFSEEEAMEYLLKVKTKNPNNFIRAVFKGFNKDVTALKIFCKENNIDCISKIQNILGEDTNEEVNFNPLSDLQIKKYFESFIKDEIAKDDVKQILSNLIKKSNNN